MCVNVVTAWTRVLIQNTGHTSGFSSFLGFGGGDNGGVEAEGRLMTALGSAPPDLTVC